MGILNPRSNSSGHVPVTMLDGEVYINQADNIIFTRNADGTICTTLLPKRLGVADTGVTVRPFDTYVGFATLSGPHTANLPPAAKYPPGQPLFLADESGNCSTANQVTILPNGQDAINGAVGLPQTQPNFGVILFSDGTSRWTAIQVAANNSAALAAAVTAAQTAQTSAETAAALVGQCRLNFVSPTQLLLRRESGRLIFVNGAARQIPPQGVPVDNTGTAGSSILYIYAFVNNGNPALEASATAPAPDPIFGQLVKGGATPDISRTLVGVVLTAANGTYQGGLCTLSFHNRRDIEAGTGNITPTTGSGSWVALAGSGMAGLCWHDEVFDVEFTGYGNIGNQNAGYYANLRAIVGDVAATTPAVYGPQSRAGGTAYVSGGLGSRAFARPGVVSAFGGWAQGFSDAGAYVASYTIAGIIKTRG